MGYVHIENPNILDLAAWQQMISVVNDHSTAISAITDKYSQTGAANVVWTDPTFAGTYNLGSQKIVYGKTKIVVADEDITAAGVHHGAISFTSTTTSAFTNSPVVTATVAYGNTDLPGDSTAPFIITMYNVSKTGFNYRVINPRSKAGSVVAAGNWFYIHWTAIGPK